MKTKYAWLVVFVIWPLMISPGTALSESITLTYDDSVYSYHEYLRENERLSISFSGNKANKLSILITDAENWLNPLFSYYDKDDITQDSYIFEAPEDQTYWVFIMGDIQRHTTTTTDPPVTVHLILKNQTGTVREDKILTFTASNRSYTSSSWYLDQNEQFSYTYSTTTTKGIEKITFERLGLWAPIRTETNVTSGAYTVTASTYDAYYCTVTGAVHTHTSTTYDDPIQVQVKIEKLLPIGTIVGIIIGIVGAVTGLLVFIWYRKMHLLPMKNDFPMQSSPKQPESHPSSSNKICMNCNWGNPFHARFCERCGKSFD